MLKIYSEEPNGNFVRVARLQNKTAPQKCLLVMKKLGP